MSFANTRVIVRFLSDHLIKLAETDNAFHRSTTSIFTFEMMAAGESASEYNTKFWESIVCGGAEVGADMSPTIFDEAVVPSGCAVGNSEDSVLWDLGLDFHLVEPEPQPQSCAHGVNRSNATESGEFKLPLRLDSDSLKVASDFDADSFLSEQLGNNGASPVVLADEDYTDPPCKRRKVASNRVIQDDAERHGCDNAPGIISKRTGSQRQRKLPPPPPPPSVAAPSQVTDVRELYTDAELKLDRAGWSACVRSKGYNLSAEARQAVSALRRAKKSCVYADNQRARKAQKAAAIAKDHTVMQEAVEALKSENFALRGEIEVLKKRLAVAP